MTKTDYPKFIAALEAVYALYRVDLSEGVGLIWIRAMEGFDLDAVVRALNDHAMNPDSGQFLPKPADVVRMLGGTTKDSAIIAWSRVDRAVRDIGGYATIVFDDPLIHRAVDDLGGWIWLCSQTNDDWPFIEKRFVDHYRAYKARNEVPDYPAKLSGITDQDNVPRGYPEMLPVLVGDPWVCARVMEKKNVDERLLPGPKPFAALAAKTMEGLTHAD